MMYIKYIFCFVSIWISVVQGNDCPPFESDIQPDICTFNDKDGNILNIPAANCSVYIGTQCCFDGIRCYNKLRSAGTIDPSTSSSSDEDPFSRPETEEEEVTGNRRTGNTVLTGCGPPTLPKEFPSTCKFPKFVKIPYVLDPPVDIPYCLRIPCSLDSVDQAKYDSSIRECGIQPGCYFDRELAQLREKYGDSVLPGVPICHFAIRNPTFHKHALKVVEKFGFWNPYFTSCTLEQFKDEIEEEPIGCKFIPYMQAFNVSPKMAGWKNINSKSCSLIGACWRKDQGCFYPAEINKVNVKSGQRFGVNPLEMQYGRPRCQVFNTANPYEILKSYHQCLAAGCSVVRDYELAYYPLLFQIGQMMPAVADHWDYWRQVQSGQLNAKDIIEGIRWNWNNNFPANFKLDSLKPTQATIPIPGVPQNFCEETRRLFGLRPCAPQYSPPPQSMSCPFKPIPQYKTLKGSLDNCCDINPCYLSKADIREMHSGPSYYYTEWSAYGPCSTNSGNGDTKRIRKCLSQDRSLCTEIEEETKTCGNWERWGRWSRCPGFCQRRVRTRQCSTGNNSDCKGISSEQQLCNCWGK